MVQLFIVDTFQFNFNFLADKHQVHQEHLYNFNLNKYVFLKGNCIFSVMFFIE